MSRAFVKESDGDDPGALPERRISQHPNLVTARGLRLIEEQIARLEAEYATARAADDRAAIAHLSRDLRYWSARRASAQLAPPPAGAGKVAFGVRVTIEDAEGEQRSYRLVGEDEADPAEGRISWFAPIARALAGREVGDIVAGPRGEFEILEIEPASET
ncbi:MAG: GreA/GreB family elongation factor [Myxococcales bacterium]|nr:GreA/GreB family elongation factor [Myxococcales bacterium]MDH5306178.1 GreA/GreB family elongation factor [Myxococcales bacterium]MDH5566133.1 GreA/GreB family elongation factor [Myxococcales bacterium]